MFVALDFTLVSEWFMKWIKGTNQPSFKSFKLVLRLGLENISMRYRIGDTHGNMISGPETVYLSTRYILRIVRLGQLRKLDVYQKGILVKKYDKDIDKRKKGIFVSTIPGALEVVVVCHTNLFRFEWCYGSTATSILDCIFTFLMKVTSSQSVLFQVPPCKQWRKAKPLKGDHFDGYEKYDHHIKDDDIHL